jgi:hypothetical protein
MGEVKRWSCDALDLPRECPKGSCVDHVDYAILLDRVVGLERERDEAVREARHHKGVVIACERDYKYRLAEAQAELSRLRAVEARTKEVSDAMMMRANAWKQLPLSAGWAGEALALFAVSLAEACGRKG